MTVQLPETWAYSYEPNYNGMYFHQVFTQARSLDKEEGNIAEDVKVLNFHYGTDEGHFSVYQGERTEDTEKWDEYTFPDGTSGGRMVSGRDGRYQEELYHEGTGMFVCLDASKSEYKKYKQEIRLVLDSIAFGTKSLPERMESDGEIVEPYELHLYEWALKVDMLARVGVSMEWEGDTLKEQPTHYGYADNRRYAFGGCERLSYGENGENIMYIGTELIEPDGTEPQKAYTVVLESGMRGNAPISYMRGRNGPVSRFLIPMSASCSMGMKWRRCCSPSVLGRDCGEIIH